MNRVKGLMTLLLIVGSAVIAQNCNGKSQETVKKSETTLCCSTDAEVVAYYFHGTRRCATCEAVEAVSMDVIKKHFDGKVKFISLNREEEANHELVEKYKVSGQTLLIIKGENVVNLTNMAFMNARNNPEKLENKIQETINSML